MNRFLTVDDILTLDPGDDYVKNNGALIRRYIGEGMKLVDILRMDAVPIRDRVWLACEALPWDVIGEPIMVEVDRQVEACCLGCGVEETETWARRWLSGEDRSTAAAWDAAGAAARAAARAAAGAAARAAGASRASRASWAARAAARAAGDAASYQRILNGIITLLQTKEKNNSLYDINMRGYSGK